LPASALNTWLWYDRRGQVIKTDAPGGLVTKYVHDGAGRLRKVYTTDGGGDPGEEKGEEKSAMPE